MQNKTNQPTKGGISVKGINSFQPIWRNRHGARSSCLITKSFIRNRRPISIVPKTTGLSQRSLSLARNRVEIMTLVVLAAVMLTGCTVTWISSYDETTDKGVTALQKSVASLLDHVDQNPVPAYTALKPTYDSIRSELNSLHLRNEARPNNTLTVKQLDELQAAFNDLEKQHKDGRLNQAMVGPARQSLDQAFRAILKLELEKKQLNKGE
jgi:hypothetical protein